jgi:hypothetical protein
MKRSIFAATLALGLSAGLTAAALADELATQPSASQTAQEAYSAYKSNTNPANSVHTTGPYDQEDLYVGRHGFPLEGWSLMGEPQS